MIYISAEAEAMMTTDALQSFPDECCGFFFGTEDQAGNRQVNNILIVNNAKAGDKRRRFEIPAKDYLSAERKAEELGQALLGVYHSHPNHPAIPSEHDRVAAQPYFSYIILSVHDEEVNAIRSWRLDDNFQFEEEDVTLDILTNK